MIKIVEKIDIAEAYSTLINEGAGAINIFIGTVRNSTGGKNVVKLEFEAYGPMAVKEMQKLATLAQQNWQLFSVTLIHATGQKTPGEPVVFIGVAAPHRQASFEACRFLIDELKKSVPIWKREFFDDDSVWVNAHP